MPRRRRDVIAFVTSQYLSKDALLEGPSSSRASRACIAFNCALHQWAAQAQAVATGIQRLDGGETSVHLFTPCFSPALASSMSRCRADDSGCPARIHVHQQHARELVAAVEAMEAYADEHRPCCPEWDSGANGLRMLLRWEIFAMTSVKVAVYLDLDLEVLPRWSLLLLRAARRESDAGSVAAEATNGARDGVRQSGDAWDRREADPVVQKVSADWLHLARCAVGRNGSGFSLLSYPDPSSPVNGALLIARPDASLYAEGVAVLRRVPHIGPFNKSLGWENGGLPSATVPPSDHVWWRRRGHTHVVDERSWDFVGGKTDQGFLFYMLRVRHRLGGDVRLVPSCSRESAPGVEPSYYYHYGSAGGTKPEQMLQRWHSMKLKKRCYGRVVPHFVEDGTVLSRTVGWARRTRAEIYEMMRRLESNDDETSLLAKVELSGFSSIIESGLSCLAAAARSGRRSYNISMPSRHSTATRPLRHVSVPSEQLLAASNDRIGARAIPLLSPAQTTGRWAPYSPTSRYPV